MFDAVEVGNKLTKAEWKKRVPVLRSELLEAQRELASHGRSVVIVVSGAEGAGKEETVDLLMEWLDARGVEVHAFGAPTDEERARPPMWRFWRTLPAEGRMAVLFGSWYSNPIIRRVLGETTDVQMEHEANRIVSFERMIAADGVHLVKLWLHLSKPSQEKRLKALKADPRTRWRVRKETWSYFEQYDEFRAASETMLRWTDLPEAPWHVIEAADDRFREVAVGAVLLREIKAAIAADEADRKAREASPPSPMLVPKTPRRRKHVLSDLAVAHPMAREPYEKQLGALQGKIARQARKLAEDQRSLVLVFEGNDAAGKGGAIRRITQAVDARLWRVIGTAAPTDEERAHPYLWRFWRHIPRHGQITIYDRSWYGRVLVERVEGFAAEAEWRRAFHEISDFESQLVESGTTIVKFWLGVTQEEQLRRFKDRKETPWKQYKLTEEDWRNRGRWNAYELAAVDMIERTSAPQAPWVVVAADDKRAARIKVLGEVLSALRRARGKG